MCVRVCVCVRAHDHLHCVLLLARSSRLNEECLFDCQTCRSVPISLSCLLLTYRDGHQFDSIANWHSTDHAQLKIHIQPHTHAHTHTQRLMNISNTPIIRFDFDRCIWVNVQLCSLRIFTRQPCTHVQMGCYKCFLLTRPTIKCHWQLTVNITCNQLQYYVH